MSLPRKLHRIWLGDKPIPAESERYWRRFAELNRGWELTTWREPPPWMPLRDLYERASTWTSRSDVLRFAILHRLGGIYVDVDVEPLRSFAPLLQHGAFAGWEDSRSLCGAVMGSEPGHPAIGALLDTLPSWVAGRSRAEPHEWAGPRFLTAQWSGREDVELLPTEAFYPKHWASGSALRDTRRSFAIHHWAKSWGPVIEPSISTCMAWVDLGDPYRNRVKEWVEAYWRSKLPDAEFVIGSDPREPFNRSACFNRAAERASGEVLFTVDADCVIDPDVIRTAATLVTENRCWVVPWYTNWRLTESSTLGLLEQDPQGYRAPPRPEPRSYDGREAGIGLQFGGFAEVVPRAAWSHLGGMDERFEGWGSEDIGFSLAMDTLWGPHLVPNSGGLHLYHDRPRRDTANPALELDYWAASGKPQAMAELIGCEISEPGREAEVPMGWTSSRRLRRRPGQAPHSRERYLRGLLVPT